MTKRFSKKTVAFFLITFAICGFFSFDGFGVAKAQTNPPVTSNIYYTDSAGNKFVYDGGGIWSSLNANGVSRGDHLSNVVSPTATDPNSGGGGATYGAPQSTYGTEENAWDSTHTSAAQGQGNGRV